MTTTATETPETRTGLPVGAWTVDPVHSQVGFAVDYMIGTFHGSFAPVVASLAVAEDGQAQLSGQAPVSGVHVQDENLAAHLQSPEFFDAERAPAIRFRSEAIEAVAGQVEIRGQIEIRGVSQPLTLVGAATEVKPDPWGQDRFGLSLTGGLDRTLFGITWNNPLPSGEPALADEVKLTAELYLVRAQGEEA